MKQLIILLIACVVQLYAKAQLPTQDPYPNTVTAATQINKYNFFVDSVSTVNIQPLAFTATNGNTTAATAISLVGVTSGVHQLYAQVVATNGVPSITNLGNFYMEGGTQYANAPASASQINKYRFYVDSVSAVNEQVLPFAEGFTDVTPAATINITGTTSGVHQLYVKVSNQNGVESITNIGNFFMAGNNFYSNAPATAVQINKYSFFVDSVSTVNEQPLAFIAAANNSTPSTPINLTGVTSGVHQLYAKIITINGVPSVTNLGNFYMEGDNLYTNVPAAATAINRYEFYLDSVTTNNIQPLAFTASTQNSTPNTTVSLLGVLPGIHQLYARVFTTNNVPSIVNLGVFAMDQNFRYADAEPPAAPLQNLEYYIDEDPGIGLANPITVSGTNITEVLNNININIPNNLITGTHFLHIRSKQNPWSIDNAMPFNVGLVVPVTWLYIKAQLLTTDNTIIQWATAQETNSLLFDIEWSINGVNFVKIGSLAAKGNSSIVSTYNYIHTKAANGINYYRIKQMDVDGKFKYSEIVKVFQKQKGTLTIYPNPATTLIQLDFSGKEKTVLIAIFDAQGKQIIQTSIQNTSPLKLNVQALPTGKYFLQISDGVINEKGSFIKQ